MDYFCDKINSNATVVPVNHFVVEAALDSISVCLCRVSKLPEWSMESIFLRCFELWLLQFTFECLILKEGLFNVPGQGKVSTGSVNA